MVQVLRTEIQLKSHIWSEIVSRYKLNQVVSEMHLQTVWRQMQRCWQPVIWYLLPQEQKVQEEQVVLAAVTLGTGVDELQDRFEKRGQLLDAYVVDCLSMEALRCFYGVLEKELEMKGFFISRYIFSEPDDLDGNDTKSLLELLQADIQMTPEGMMRPLKSVVYRGILTEEPPAECTSVCENCKNTACPHRDLLNTENYREPGVLKYSYGYQRIFGKK